MASDNSDEWGCFHWIVLLALFCVCNDQSGIERKLDRALDALERKSPEAQPTEGTDERNHD